MTALVLLLVGIAIVASCLAYVVAHRTLHRKQRPMRMTEPEVVALRARIRARLAATPTDILHEVRRHFPKCVRCGQMTSADDAQRGLVRIAVSNRYRVEHVAPCRPLDAMIAVGRVPTTDLETGR